MGSISENNSYDACLICLSDIKTDARTLNLARFLSGKGMKTLVISVKDINYDENYSNSDFENIRIPINTRIRLINKFYQFTKAIFKLSGTIPSKIYFAMDIYSLTAANHLKKKYSGNLVYDSREIYSALSTLSSRHFSQKLLTAYEKHYLKHLDLICVSGELDAEYMLDYTKSENKIAILKNYPPLRKKVNSNLLREKYKIPEDKKIILYQGVILPGRGLDKTIEAMAYTDEMVLTIIGDGSYRTELRNQVLQKGLAGKVIFCGSIPYDELHEWTCSADIGVSLIEPISYSYELALPNKLFEYCMAGLPVVASDLPAIRKVYDEFQIGAIIGSESSPEEIESALEKIFDNYEYYSSECSKAAESFNYESQAEVIIKMIVNL